MLATIMTKLKPRLFANQWVNDESYVPALQNKRTD
jgi:hypothetical protein